ncbi:hypothetical protein [Vibrio sp. 10N.247.311.51]
MFKKTAVAVTLALASSYAVANECANVPEWIDYYPQQMKVI